MGDRRQDLDIFKPKKYVPWKKFAIPAELRVALTTGLMMSNHSVSVKYVATIGQIINEKKLFVKVHKAVVLSHLLAFICALKTLDFS